MIEFSTKTFRFEGTYLVKIMEHPLSDNRIEVGKTVMAMYDISCSWDEMVDHLKVSLPLHIGDLDCTDFECSDIEEWNATFKKHDWMGGFFEFIFDSEKPPLKIELDQR